MKRIYIFFLAIVFLFQSLPVFSLADDNNLIINLSEATDEELADAISKIQAEQRSRIKTSIVLDNAEITINKGRTQKLTAKVIDLADDVTAGKFAWSTSDDTVATCDKTGVVKGIGAGTAVITCSCELSDGMTIAENCSVTVQVPVQGIKAQKTKIEVMASDSFYPELTFTPADATNTAVSFSSANENIVSVDENGNLLAVAPGTTSITVSTVDGSNRTIKLNVTVSKRIGKFDDELTFQGLEWGSDDTECWSKLQDIGFVASDANKRNTMFWPNFYYWPEHEFEFLTAMHGFRLPVALQDNRMGTARLSIEPQKKVVGFMPQYAHLEYVNGVSDSGEIDSNIKQLVGVCIRFDNEHEPGSEIFNTLLNKLEEQYGEFTRFVHSNFSNKNYAEVYGAIKDNLKGAKQFKSYELGRELYIPVGAVCSLQGKNSTGIILAIDGSGNVTLFYGKLDAHDRILEISDIMESKPDDTGNIGV